MYYFVHVFIIYLFLVLALVVDHILLLFSDEVIIDSLHLNPFEVKSIKFVNISELNCLNPSTSLTPWLQKILSSDLLSSWISTVQSIGNSSDKSVIKTTKYSNDLIIKL